MAGFLTGYLGPMRGFGNAREQALTDFMARATETTKLREQQAADLMNKAIGLTPGYMQGDPSATMGLAAMGIGRPPVPAAEQERARQEKEYQRVQEEGRVQREQERMKLGEQRFQASQKTAQAQLKLQEQQQKALAQQRKEVSEARAKTTEEREAGKEAASALWLPLIQQERPELSREEQQAMALQESLFGAPSKTERQASKKRVEQKELESIASYLRNWRSLPTDQFTEASKQVNELLKKRGVGFEKGYEQAAKYLRQKGMPLEMLGEYGEKIRERETMKALELLTGQAQARAAGKPAKPPKGLTPEVFADWEAYKAADDETKAATRAAIIADARAGDPDAQMLATKIGLRWE